MPSTPVVLLIASPVLVFAGVIVTTWATRRTARDARAAAVQEVRDKYEISLLEQGNAMRKEAVEEAKRLREENAELRDDIEQMTRKIDQQAERILELEKKVQRFDDERKK